MSAPPGFLSIRQAAEQLGVSPWDVKKLIEERRLLSVTFVDESSLHTYKEANA